MEHEDNAQLDNILQSSHMENLQLDGGDGVRENLTVDEIGGKFEGHEGQNDEEEWKYIEEGKQSEKQQQQMKAGMDFKDLEGVEEVGNGHGYGYEHGDVGADDNLQDYHEVGNGVVGSSAAVDVDIGSAATGVGENEIDEEIIKNDGDFSTTSNTASTAGEDVDTGVFQVEMQIEQAPFEQLLPKQDEDILGVGANSGITPDETEEDDPSSLATNNTNRTSSLSENIAHEIQQLGVEVSPNSQELNQESKTNVSLLQTKIDSGLSENSDFESETRSQLNPNAMEFVPSFGSNPSSPTVLPNDNSAFEVGEHSLGIGTEMCNQPHPKTMPRHLLGDDDFVAQSPRKGSGESNLDGIALPEENDFEHEAAKRPHELEQEDDLIGVGTLQQFPQQSQLNHEHFENHNNDGVHLNETETRTEDSFDNSQSHLIDHGPETSVDLDIDMDLQIATAKECESNPNLIEDVLNTVQPLPRDSESLNASFVEESTQQSFAAVDKELLDIDEKENVSHSPSTEEVHLNFQNELNSSVKDIPQIPRDMENLAHMQESIYVESTSADSQSLHENPFESHFDTPKLQTEEENVKSQEQNLYVKDTFGAESDVGLGSSPTLNAFAAQFTPTPKPFGADAISPSPISTEEKHMIEETKERLKFGTTLENLEQEMNDLLLSTRDEDLSQVEDIDNVNPFNAPESEQLASNEQFRFEDQPISAESQANADFLQQNEPNYHNEQFEQQLSSQRETSEPAYDNEEKNLFSLNSELNGFEENILVATSVANHAINSAEPDIIALSGEPNLVPTYADQNEASVVEPGFTAVIEKEISASPEAQVSAVSESEIIALSEQKIETVPEPDNTVIPQADILASPELEVEAVPEQETKSVLEAEIVSQTEPVVDVFDTKPSNNLEISGELVSNLSAGGDESLLAPTPLETTVLESSVDEVKPSDKNESVTAAVVAGAVGAVAATAAAATVAAASGKKTDNKQARTSTSLKSKSIDTKKTTETTKKPIAKTSASSVSARPRTAPTKTTTTTEKKTSTNTVGTKPSTTVTSTTTRKPLTTNTAAPRTVTKTATTTRPTTAPASSRLTASRTAVTTTTARRLTTATTGGSTTTSNGTSTAKPKTASGAPTKPTTLGLSATNKPKLSSPRTTLTSQLRKSAPPSSASGLAAAKSPLKTTAPTTNGVSKSSTTTTTASRAKSAASTTLTTVTTTTKTFTARPAPKTTHSSTLSSTTTRRTVGSTSSSTTGAKTTSSTLIKKTSPGSTRPATTGKLSLSPTKTTNVALKAKPRDVTKKTGTPSKSSNESKPKVVEEELKTNGISKVGETDAAVSLENQKLQLNGGGGGGDQQVIENGTRQLDLENGEGPLTEQIQATLLDA